MSRVHLGPVLWMVIFCAAIWNVDAGNQSLTTGMYAATLGAGGATAGERDAFGQNPAAFYPSQSGKMRAGFHLDFHRPYGMEDLQVADAGAFCDFSKGGFALAWRQTGIDNLYREQGLSLTPTLGLRRLWTRIPIKVDLGGSWTWWRTESAQENPRIEESYGVGILWHTLPRLKVGAFTSGRSLPWSNTRPEENIWQWGIEANSGKPAGGKRTWPSQSLHLDFRKVGGTPWRSLAGLTLSPHPALRISAGFSSPPFQVSLGLNLGWEGLQWFQSLRYHRYLGRTSLSGVAFAHELAIGRQ